MHIREKIGNCRELLNDWDATFFNKEKVTNKFVGYAISRGLLSAHLAGLILGAKVGIDALTVLPPQDEAVYLAGSGIAISGTILFTAIRIVGGREERRNYLRSLQDGPR